MATKPLPRKTRVVNRGYQYSRSKKDKVKNITVVTSGNSNDYRFPDHYSNLEIFIKKEKLNKNILYLGIIPIKDVYSLIKRSLAVINPSFYEGWGNTLEHAINLKKIAIISNIDVHREKISKLIQ